MRYSFALALAVGCCGTAPVLAQSYPSEQVVLQKDAEVRSGPGANFMLTSKLAQNDRVYVVRESKEGEGWLEIAPPKGSFSWIKSQYVKNYKPGDRLSAIDPTSNQVAIVFAGSTLVNQTPDRECMRLTPGTIVAIVDRPLTVGGETWLPIQPQPTEVRYIRKETVSPATTVQATSNSPPNWTLGGSAYYKNELLARAAQAEKNNDFTSARQLYEYVANNATDASDKTFALNSLSRLQQAGRTPAQTVSNQKPAETRTALSPSNPLNLMQLQAPAWSTYGRLMDTGIKREEDGQPIYSLEDAKGVRIAYVTSNPKTSLQSFLGRMIAVYGPTMYRPDSPSRMQYIVASHVAQP